MKYRIDSYTGWSVYDGLILREYKRFKCVDDAKVYAYLLAQKHGEKCGYSLQLVQ